MRTRERMQAPATTGTPPLPDRNDTAHGAARLTRLAIGAIGLYALAALVLLPEGSPSTVARLLFGILVASAVMLALLVVGIGSGLGAGRPSAHHGLHDDRR